MSRSSEVQYHLMWRSYQLKFTKMLTYFKCFCDMCVTRMVLFWLKCILFKYISFLSHHHKQNAYRGYHKSHATNNFSEFLYIYVFTYTSNHWRHITSNSNETRKNTLMWEIDIAVSVINYQFQHQLHKSELFMFTDERSRNWNRRILTCHVTYGRWMTRWAVWEKVTET